MNAQPSCAPRDERLPFITLPIRSWRRAARVLDIGSIAARAFIGTYRTPRIQRILTATQLSGAIKPRKPKALLSNVSEDRTSLYGSELTAIHFSSHSVVSLNGPGCVTGVGKADDAARLGEEGLTQC